MYKCLSLLLLLSVNCLSQTCLSSINETAPSENFVDNGDGTVSDVSSGLMWMRCSLGQNWSEGSCVGDAHELNWQQALQEAHGKEFAGKAGWRLPNIKELRTLSERSCVRPAINSDIFPNTPSDDFWTSTPAVTDSSRAWVVAFFNSSNSVKQKNLFVYARLVRNAD
jgi:hypothetical protein